MSPNHHPPAMTPEDLQTLRDLAGRYGPENLAQALQSITVAHTPLPLRPQQSGAPARISALSISTSGSNNNPPSLTSSGPWSSSDASLLGSDAASFEGSYYSQSPATWVDAVVPAFSLPPSETPFLSGPEWHERYISQQAASPPCEEAIGMTKSKSAACSSRNPIECPVCAVYDVFVEFETKNDFKKHLKRVHSTDYIWVCPQADCRMVFDFEEAFKTHVKIGHGDSYPRPDQAKLELCPQVVFACGFIGCKIVYEATNDSDATAVAEMYNEHLASHFDENGASAEWTYCHQMRNLLRQRCLKDEWKHMLWDKTARNQLRWQPRSSGDLKKLFECRHLTHVPKILHAAWTLGQTCFSSPEHPAPEFPGEATRPVRSRCTLSAKGHHELHVTHQEASSSLLLSPSPAPKTNLSLRRNRLPVKLATVSYPPPRSTPDEPNSIDYPHPGTPLSLPDGRDWSTNLVLGPPEDEQSSDKMLHPSAVTSNPISPWSDAHSVGDLSPRTPPSGGGHEGFGAFFKLPHSRRHLSWGRSLENLRLKRRGGPSPDDKAALPAWI